MLDDIKSTLWNLVADTKVLIGLLAAVALGLLWLATSFDISDASMHPRVVAAIITVIGTIAGIIIAAIIGAIRDWQRDRRERTRLATALLNEIYGHADIIATCGSLVNSKEKHDEFLLRDEMIRFEPPDAIVYGSLVSQIVIFPHVDAGSVVAFYGSLYSAKHVTQALPDQLPTPSVPYGHNTQQAIQARSRSASAWRSAATNAIKAIKSLRKYSKISRGGEGGELLESLMEELADVALNNGTPRFKDYDKGHS